MQTDAGGIVDQIRCFMLGQKTSVAPFSGTDEGQFERASLSSVIGLIKGWL